MNCSCKLLVKIPFYAIDHHGKMFNTNIAKVQAQNVFFWPLDDIELGDWNLQTNLQDFGFVGIFTTCLFSN
jgi:hypothetical protein